MRSTEKSCLEAFTSSVSFFWGALLTEVPAEGVCQSCLSAPGACSPSLASPRGGHLRLLLGTCSASLKELVTGLLGIRKATWQLLSALVGVTEF